MTWPRFDPLTNRKICHNCWNGCHWFVYGKDGFLIPALTKGACRESACDGECDCIHLSEMTYAEIERTRHNKALKVRRELERQTLESNDNPLRAENPEWKPKEKFRPHA